MSGHRAHALVVGIDGYACHSAGGDDYPPLRGCVHDARRVVALLVDELGLACDHLELLTSPAVPESLAPPTYRELLAAFERLLRRARPGDGVWIHYSGHGGRTATALPELRGAAGIDEALVPCDVGRPGGRYLRDLEVCYLLERLVRHGLLVTLVLDCCHAGGMVRGAAWPEVPAPRVRGHDTEGWEPAEPSAAAGADRLMASWRRFGAPWRRLAGDEKAAARWDRAGLVVLAACRPHERAFEYDVAPGEAGGALTSALVEAVRELGGAAATHRQVFERVRGRLRSCFDGFQTPQLAGEADRRLLGAETGVGARGVTVLTVADDRVLLATGEAQGVGEGARFGIEPLHPGEGAAAGGEARSLVEVVKAGGGESWARWLVRGAKAVRPGDRALPDRFAAPRCPVSFRRRDRRDDRRFARLAAETGALSSPFVRWLDDAGGEMEADVTVALEAGDQVVVRNGSGEPLEHTVPPGDLRTLRAADLAASLEHLARYRAVERLGRGLPVRADLAVDLGRLPARFRPERDPIEPLESAGAAVSVAAESWIALSIESRSDRYLEVAVLDLAPDWSITQVYPAEGDSLTLEPGRCERLPLLARLAPGSLRDLHRLRVFASGDPVRWHWLALPRWGDSPVRGAWAPPRNELERALQCLWHGGGAEPEASTRSGRAHREWTVADCTIEIHPLSPAIS